MLLPLGGGVSALAEVMLKRNARLPLENTTTGNAAKWRRFRQILQNRESPEFTRLYRAMRLSSEGGDEGPKIHLKGRTSEEFDSAEVLQQHDITDQHIDLLVHNELSIC
jgi:hypothetical protein